MTSELLEEVEKYLHQHPGLALVPSDVAETLLRRTRKGCLIALDSSWPWEGLRNPRVSLDYSGGDGLVMLGRLLPGSESLFLFITDERPPPWPCVEGHGESIVSLLENMWFFEYFIVPSDGAWIIFDMHHNLLLGAGDSCPLIGAGQQ